jgi:hypothetical protein
MARTISERSNSPQEFYRIMMETLSTNLRVAIPGIIVAFDALTQTATVQPSIKENVSDASLNIKSVSLPPLLDVPVYFPRAGGFCLTMPVKKGDECLVIFADMCIDGWWDLGGIQNQVEKRRHDLSDAFAFVGVQSKPKKISNYSTNSVQLRNDSKTSYIDLKTGEIDIVSPIVKINGVNFAEYSTHKHSGVTTGSGQTGGPI